MSTPRRKARLSTKLADNTWVVGKLGYYTPWALVSAVLAAIGAGLLGTLLPDSSTGRWIGYQIISGTGRGFGLQMVTLLPTV
jgi:hypothetical protein